MGEFAKLLWVIVGLVALGAVTLGPAIGMRHAPSPIASGSVTHTIEYLRDDRTGLCFATLLSGGGPTTAPVRTLVVVPCEPVVRLYGGGP